MSPIANMVREMLARGVAADVIVIAVEAAEQVSMRVEIPQNSADASAERRRARDRDRKRSKAGIPQNSADIPQNSTTPLTLTSSQGTSEEVKEGKKVRARKAIAGPLSAEFQPNEKHFEAATKLGIPRQAVFDKCEDMRIWAASSGSIKADWDATLHGFLRRDADKLKSNKPTVHDAARNLSNNVQDLIRDLDRPAPSGLREPEGGGPVRLLSSR